MIDTVRHLGDPSDLAQASQVLARTAEWSGFDAGDLVGPSRKAPLVWHRHLAIAAIRRSTELSLTQIGAIFGGRDHTTIIHALRRIDGAAKWRPEVEARLRLLSAGTSGE